MAVVNNFEVETLTNQYNSATELLLQQMDTRLRGAVKTGFHVGKGASPVQYAGAVEFKTAGPRGSLLEPQDVQWQRRWVFPSDKDLTLRRDTFDELRTIIDPASALVRSIQAAGARLFDDVIINGVNSSGGFFGTCKIGVDDSSLTSETFDSGADFPTSVSIADTFGTTAASSMTVAKWIEARRILRHYENDLEAEMCHVAISSEEEASLMKQLEFTSKEFRDTATYDMTGRAKSFLGTMIHYSERLQISSSDRLVPMWLEDGMYLGIWSDMSTTISHETLLTGQPWQAYTRVTLGSTRLQGGKIVKIACAETAGGDITN
jgi:capsid protein